MSSLPEDQLTELLVQLKKTTPEQARAILNGQPQISYALIALMVRMNAVDVGTMTKHISSYGVPTGPTMQPQATSSIAAAPPQVPAMQPGIYRTPDPRNMYGGTQQSSSQAYTGPLPHGSQPHPVGHVSPAPPYLQANPTHSTSASGQYQLPTQGNPQFLSDTTGRGGYDNGYNRNPSGAPGLQPGVTPQPAGLPDTFAHFPEEQKALMMRVISMTPEEIHRLPPTERAGMIQLRATLGLPT